MCLCMHDTHRERETHTHRCLKGILLSNEEKNRCDTWGRTRESEKASRAEIRQRDFWGGGTVCKKVFLVYLALMILYRKC